MKQHLLTAALLMGLLIVPVAAFAQDGITVEVIASPACGSASFEVQASGGIAPYGLTWDFGDGEVQLDAGVAAFPFMTSHEYGAAGEFAWTLLVTDSTVPALSGQAGGTLLLGPQVTLTADVFPPLLTLVDGAATLNFTAQATGGEPPYTYVWDLDGDGVFEAGTDTAAFTYTSGGKYSAVVQVTDNCGLTASAVLTVVVVDPEAEACHPMAQRIADGVNSLFPIQAGQLYTCEDIFAIFEGSLTGHNLGFGRMWHAYKLASTLEDMTWEEILQWHLEGTGWGLLVQLDRFAETLGDVGPGELVDMVLAGDATVGEIRTAVRLTSRYDADFVEALGLVQGGANPGEIGQMYRTATEMGLDLLAVQGYLDQGLSLPELRHAARMAEQGGMDLDLAAQAHLDGLSWGEVNQAMRLAEDGHDLPAILEAGVRETRRLEQQERQQEREREREEDRTQQQLEHGTRTAARLAQRYAISVERVQALFDGACAGDWACVQTTLQEQYPAEHGKGGGPK
jgi:PKD repeat protein